MDLPARLSASRRPATDNSTPRHTRSPALRADPAAQLRLLDLQALDSRADQVRHQRSHLPELAEIAALQPVRDDLDDQRRDARIVVDDLEAERTKVEADVASVRTRRTRDQDRMDKGLITSPKDLERMQGELVSLQRRIATLEDEELEVMVRLEEAQSTLDDLTTRVEETDARLGELLAARDEKGATLDTDLQAVEAERAPVAAEIPGDLLALYDKLRASKGGVAAAELRQRACGGCRLTVDYAELSRIAGTAPDQVVRCEECSRIMVRTAESGL